MDIVLSSNEGLARLSLRLSFWCPYSGGGSEMAERLGSRAFNQKVAGSISGCEKNDVSLGKALHPTCLGWNVPVLTVNRSG